MDRYIIDKYMVCNNLKKQYSMYTLHRFSFFTVQKKLILTWRCNNLYLINYLDISFSSLAI